MPGVRRAVDATTAERPSPWSTRSRRTQATVAAIGSGHSLAGTRGTELDQRMPARVALPVPRPAPSDGELQLHHRLEPVDVGPLQHADLDQSHGPGRIATEAPRRLPPMTSRTPDRPPRRRRRPRPRARGAARIDRGRPACLPRGPRAARQHRLRVVHAGGRERGRPLDGAVPGGARAPRSTFVPIPTGALRQHVVATFHGRADGPRVLLIGHMDTVFDPGTAAARPFRIDDDDRATGRASPT